MGRLVSLDITWVTAVQVSVAAIVFMSIAWTSGVSFLSILVTSSFQQLSLITVASAGVGIVVGRTLSWLLR